MPVKEVTNNRPKNYSKWHRPESGNLPNWCYQTDGDFFEQRIIDNHLSVVAYIETIEIPMNSDFINYNVWESKKCLLDDIKKMMGIDCYVVWHYPDCSIFFVMRWDNGCIIKMFENEYIQFISNLGKVK